MHVQIWPETERRQYKQALDAYEAAEAVRSESEMARPRTRRAPGKPAFNHVRLAAALAASGQQVDPEALPFMAIELAGNAMEFDAFGEHWR